ncbi:Calcipressin-1 [Apiospora hydei]|uniref:Calcipressin-1 n=1 Tax=Apiospora hydei TaxID=1337664 RepID=A0ABR1XD03_9PEZI
MSGSPTSLPARPEFSRMRRASSLKLDLSSLPPLTQPTPPTNTLLLTNLGDLDIFRPDNLQTIRELISTTAPVYTWAPLKSFRRIVVSFFDEESAIKVRQVWDGEAIMGQRCRPSPSPPHGWEQTLEDAPNKLVHADDLAAALAKLHHRAPDAAMASPVSPTDGNSATTRSRSSTLIFQPKESTGNSPTLPSIAVDDMTDSPMELNSPSPLSSPKPIMAHTSRPPVELME